MSRCRAGFARYSPTLSSARPMPVCSVLGATVTIALNTSLFVRVKVPQLSAPFPQNASEQSLPSPSIKSTETVASHFSGPLALTASVVTCDICPPKSTLINTGQALVASGISSTLAQPAPTILDMAGGGSPSDFTDAGAQ